MKWILVMALLVLSLAPSLPDQFVAWAHPFTEQTIPSMTSNAPVGTTEVVAFFTEPIDINFSEIRIFDGNGDQIDNRDTAYYEDESSLIVTTPPLGEGTYTATTKVLSKVDGHLVPGAFVFGVGNVIIEQSADGADAIDETPFLPGAGAKFPGMVGQTIVLGAAIASLVIWGTQNKQFLSNARQGGLEMMQQIYRKKFMLVTGIGLMLVFVSDILIIAVQSIRLEASPVDVIQTHFGTVWLARMAITIVLLGIWFGMDRLKSPLGSKNQIPMAAASLALIATTSLVGHGAATDQTGALVLDYVHNLVAAVWIGGIIYFAFVLHPALGRLGDAYREKMSLVLIPRFSIAFVISVGIVIVTGPTLLWFLEDDVSMITGSVFGQLIMLKIAIAAAMVGLGGLNQFKIQRGGEEGISSDRGGAAKMSVHARLRPALRADVALGVALLAVVALLTNGTPPVDGQQDVIGGAQGTMMTTYGFNTAVFTENAMFDVEILPFSQGPNTILIRASDAQGTPMSDLDQISVKISNPSRNIAPIEVQMEPVQLQEDRDDPGHGQREFGGDLTFGFFGQWLVEIQAQRTENANESAMLYLSVKPRLADIQARVTEYEFPEDGKPLYPLYDGAGSLWIGDAAAPRIWQFDLDEKSFSPHAFEGVGATFLSHDASNGRIWFTDTPGNQIGFVDTKTGEVTTVSIPVLDPTISENTPLFIQADRDGNVWVAVINKDAIVKYVPESGTFETITFPERNTLPFALTTDADGTVWYSAVGTGKIGYIDADRNAINEIQTETVLQSPEALFFDGDGILWIAEHSGQAMARFDTTLETFERIVVPDSNSLPFGMTSDRYGNIWFAQHVTDMMAVYDPDNGDLLEVPIPTAASAVQFMASDGDWNVWFVGQESNKIGIVEITGGAASVSVIPGQDGMMRDAGGGGPLGIKLGYSEIISPLVALGIIFAAVSFAKGIHDKRRLNSLVDPGYGGNGSAAA